MQVNIRYVYVNPANTAFYNLLGPKGPFIYFLVKEPQIKVRMNPAQNHRITQLWDLNDEDASLVAGIIKNGIHRDISGDTIRNGCKWD